MRYNKNALPDNRYEGMFIKQTIVKGNRIWIVYDGSKIVGEAGSQSLAEQLWISYKFGGKEHGHTRIGDSYRNRKTAEEA